MGRRVETTEYLKECISDALIYLMQSAPIDKIKIQDITDRAGVGRMTYFRYFDSKADALLYKMKLLWERWVQESPYPHNDEPRSHALWFFSFCKSIQPLLLLFYQQGMTEVLLTMFLNGCMPIEVEFGKNRYIRLYAAYGMWGVMIGWIQNNFKETPEELADICVQ